MTEEDKALQLLDRFTFYFTNDLNQAKQAALMCVYEIIDLQILNGKDITYWQKVVFYLYSIGTGELEAKADRFNLNA
jgi:hypothetical protein